MQVNDLDHDRLRRLAALHPQNGHKVLSVYMDLDPTSFGTQPARAAQITSLVDAAERRARHAELDHDAKTALRDDVARVREFLRGDEFSAKGAHGLALFASGPAGLFEVLRLPDAVQSAVSVNETPWLDPLIGHGRGRRCVALIDRRTLRIFADTPDGALREIEAFEDEVPRQHAQGGYSQANYQRSIEEEVRKHVEHSAAALLAQFQREPFEQLAVGASAELWPEIERALHSYLRERSLGRFDVLENAAADQVAAAARPLFDAAGEAHLATLLERLASGLAHGERAAAGLGDVLDALNERRVAALLFEAGFASPGYACPSSGWLGVGPTACPSGEENAQQRENVLEDAIAAAIVQRADVHVLRDRPELSPHGGIAAVLRY